MEYQEFERDGYTFNNQPLNVSARATKKPDERELTIQIPRELGWKPYGKEHYQKLSVA